MKFDDFQRKESQVKYEGQAENELPAFTNRQRRAHAATANLRRQDDRREGCDVVSRKNTGGESMSLLHLISFTKQTRQTYQKQKHQNIKKKASLRIKLTKKRCYMKKNL